MFCVTVITWDGYSREQAFSSSDKTARLWDAATGHCLQILEGHTDEIFSCAFNYNGNIIITGN
uniref:Uncharacterized protein n=1 Tax=Meleagris gallopavo TaxID=9103 RepID=A0A803Y0I7_MELGA